MLRSMLWAFVGASSLLLGAFIAFRFAIGDRFLGLVMAFGAGVLISAVSYELVEEAVAAAASPAAVAVGFVLGALVFFGGDVSIDRRLKGKEGSAGLGIVLGAVLDGIPESVVIGASLLSGGPVGVAVIVAVFLSNVPESISASADLVNGGWSRSRVLRLWALVAATSALAAGLGYVFLEGASGSWTAALQAFAAGAILTMLADEMIPEGYERAGHRKLVGVSMALGFALAAALSFRA